EANDALAAARATLDAARLADEAGTLRARLLAGQPCPVCEQPVQAVPAGHDTSHFAAAEKQLASAQSRYDRATKEHARLDRNHRDTTAVRTGTLRHVETAMVNVLAISAGAFDCSGKSEHSDSSGGKRVSERGSLNGFMLEHIFTICQAKNMRE
ncbi:MAG: hypothetical protein ACLP2X_18330, partial [Syntrophobacteraceae bacterium]